VTSAAARSPSLDRTLLQSRSSSRCWKSSPDSHLRAFNQDHRYSLGRRDRWRDGETRASLAELLPSPLELVTATTRWCCLPSASNCVYKVRMRRMHHSFGVQATCSAQTDPQERVMPIYWPVPASGSLLFDVRSGIEASVHESLPLSREGLQLLRKRVGPSSRFVANAFQSQALDRCHDPLANCCRTVCHRASRERVMGPKPDLGEYRQVESRNEPDLLSLTA